MNSKWELKEKSTGELEIVVSGETWSNAQAKAFDKLAKNVNLPGFRQGQAPKKLVEKQISKQNILMEAIDFVAGEAYSQAAEEQNLWVIARPSLDVKEITEESVTLVFTVAVKPEVTLGDYKNLEVKREEVTISQEEIEAQVAQVTERNAELVVKTEGTVEMHDTAVIDFEGFKDGVAFEGGKGENFPLEIGSGSFIPGFEEQLVGMSAGEAKDITVTFPTEYPAEELAGKETVFKVTLHEIKTKTTPALDDELVKELNIEGVETVEAFRAHVEADLLKTKTASADDAFMNELLGKVVANAEVEIPDVMVEEETDRMVQEFAQRLQQQGFSMEQFQQMTGQQEDQIRETMRTDAHSKVNLRLVLDEVAKVEGFEISEEELDAEYAGIATMYSMEVEKVKELIPADSIKYDLRLRKAVELIQNSAK
ncbi:MAG: trigger factor [Erysipelotrichaceae bacterium]